MKIVKSQNENDKSWRIGLNQDENDKDAYLNAYDSVTGKFICNLIVFDANGQIYPRSGANKALKEKGYNTREHNNTWHSPDGKLQVYAQDMNNFARR